MAKRNMAIMYGDKPNNDYYDNGVWMSILNIPYIQTEDSLEPYDTVIITQWLEAVGRNRRVKSRWPSKTVIALIDHPLSAHVSRLVPQRQLDFIRDLEYADGIMVLTEEERQWYQTAVPSKPVIKAGLPFPFEAYNKRYQEILNSERKFIGLGVGASDADRNFITSYVVFQRLKLDFPDLAGVFMSIPANMLSTVVPICDAGEDLYIHQRENMDSFYDVLSQCNFVINLADRNTPGRLQGEAAFFGVPVIGSDRLELQKELFPLLAVKPYEAERAYQLGKALLSSDPKLGNGKIVEYANKKLQNYNYRRSRKRFFELLEEIERRRG